MEPSVTERASAAAIIAELMQAWDRTMAAARRQFPNADEETLYQAAASSMNRSLALPAARVPAP